MTLLIVAERRPDSSSSSSYHGLLAQRFSEFLELLFGNFSLGKTHFSDSNRCLFFVRAVSPAAGKLLDSPNHQSGRLSLSRIRPLTR